MAAKLSLSHVDAINYEVGYMTNELIIYVLACSWIISLILIIFHGNRRILCVVPMLLKSFFVLEMTALFFWYNSSSALLNRIAYKSPSFDLQGMLYTDLIINSFYFALMCLMAAALRLLLLNWLELMARKMETKPETS